MDISTLAVYNFPCNISIDNYEMAPSTCPERLLVSLPMSTANSESYVKWKPNSSDQTTLQLHRQSLTILPETNINHSIVKELEDRYQYYDSQLSASLQKVDSLVDQINETAEDSLSVYLTYAALALYVLNSVAMIIACKCIYRVLLRRMSQVSMERLSTAYFFPRTTERVTWPDINRVYRLPATVSTRGGHFYRLEGTQKREYLQPIFTFYFSILIACFYSYDIFIACFYSYAIILILHELLVKLKEFQIQGENT